MYEEDHYERLKARLSIDILRMDDELIQHPSLLQDVCEFAADASRAHDEEKHNLELISSSVSTLIRKQNTDSNGKGPSEAKLAALVVTDKTVMKATAQLENAKQDLAYWQALVNAYRAKGSSLKHIAEMTIAGYLAPNTVRRKELSEKRRKPE